MTDRGRWWIREVILPTIIVVLFFAAAGLAAAIAGPS